MSIEIKHLGSGDVLFVLSYSKAFKRWIIREKLPRGNYGPAVFLTTDALYDLLESDPFIDAELIPATQNPLL